MKLPIVTVRCAFGAVHEIKYKWSLCSGLDWSFPLQIGTHFTGHVLQQVCFSQYWCLRCPSPEGALWNNYSTKTWLFVTEVIKPLKYWSISPSISCGSKVGAKCTGFPVTLSKGKSLSSKSGASEIYKDWWQCFWPRHLEVFCKFCQLSVNNDVNAFH